MNQRDKSHQSGVQLLLNQPHVTREFKRLFLSVSNKEQREGLWFRVFCSRAELLLFIFLRRGVGGKQHFLALASEYGQR